MESAQFVLIETKLSLRNSPSSLPLDDSLLLVSRPLRH